MNLQQLMTIMEEPALLIQNGRVAAANDRASRLFGMEELEGQKASEVLNAEIAQYACKSYLADTQIGGQNYVIHVNRVEEGKLLLFHRQDGEQTLLSDAFLYSLRGGLMNLGMAADLLRPILEEHQELGLADKMALLTSSHFKLIRMAENAAFVKGMLDKTAAASLVMQDLSLLVHSILDSVEEVLPEPKIERSIGKEIYAAVDPRLLKMLLFNLLSNAVVHAQTPTIRVRLEATQESVILGVTDDGKGIAAQTLADVFDRYRSAYSLVDINDGAGLGLAAARGVTRLHGGTLLLTSTEGVGTAVRASFNRRGVAARLSAGTELCTMRDLQIGLAGCLPVKYYDQEYLD